MQKDARSYASDIFSTWAQGTSLYVKWAASHGVNYYEMLIFYALDINGPMTQKAISDYYGLPKQTIHNVIRNLQEKNEIVLMANEKDKREKSVTLTAAGKMHSEKALAPLYHIEECVCKKIGQEKLVQMIETSDLFNILFEKEMERES